MINAMALISHTSLFKVNQTPGEVYRLQKYSMTFYLVPQFSDFASYNMREPWNRQFDEMGYFCANFIPLLYLGTIILTCLLGINFIYIIIRRITVKNHKKKYCRALGIYSPDKYLFRRLFFKIFMII